MTGNKFECVIPISPDPKYMRTTFTVRGTFLSKPKKLMINFVNSSNITDNVTYQFKVEFENHEKQWLTENYKDNGIWFYDQKKTEKNLFNESTFYLEFSLKYENSTIYVYKGRGHNTITEFPTLCGLSAIESVQVWGDVQQINAYSVSYGEVMHSPGFLNCACR